MYHYFCGIPWWLSSKESAFSAGDADLILRSGRAPGEGDGNLLPYCCPGNPWTEEPSGMQPMGLQRVRQDLVAK